MPEACNVGYHDLNGDLSGESSDGCEYQCTVTNGGVEVCDLVDNDCDNQIDEGIDTETDVANCGSCGNDCRDDFFQGKARCEAGACKFDGCQDGNYDIDGSALNGCEYACVVTNGGSEICDGLDNDCDGVVDDGVLPGVGDVCGNAAVGECRPGIRECKNGGLVCVGEVTPATEYCDGLDNDCVDGIDNECPAAHASDSRLDLGAGSGVGQATSTQLSVATQGTYVFAAYLDRRSGNADIRYNVSSNDGESFRAGSDIGIATSGNHEVEPVVFASPTRVYVAYEKFVNSYRRIFIKSASGDFTSFGGETRADHNRPASVLPDAFYLRGVVASSSGGDDTIVLVWQELDVKSGDRNIYLQRSTDNGANWLASDVRVNSSAGDADLPRIATDGAGKVFITWRDQRNDESEVFFAVYDAAANSVGANVALSGGEPGANPNVAADADGNVHVVWTDLRAEKKAIRVSSSTNSGENFPNDGKVVNPDSTFADADHPAIAASDGKVVVVWQDRRSGLSDIRANRSTNAGGSWLSQTPRVDLGRTAGTALSLAPSVTFGAGNKVYVVWADTRNGLPDIYGNHSNDAGASFQPIDLRLDLGAGAGAAASQEPLVVSPSNGAGDRAVSLWLDYRTGGGSGIHSDVYSNYFE